MVRPMCRKSALMKPLMRQLHSKKGQDRTLPASLWMRYKAVEQKNAQLCRPGLWLCIPFGHISFGQIPLRGQVSSP
ncbi:hypothetical protein PG1C_01065 [Rugosibacter aromaticivorans]|uniref:Uncharacterized protein n=1 Tax=Rugosibacter aromaticivorans TaxID=1565605 RepID=A0A0C5IXJ2_9PROT|nr:hypothetical protein PG1C_01065 [Rugosibacter aromaticivorans]